MKLNVIKLFSFMMIAVFLFGTLNEADAQRRKKRKKKNKKELVVDSLGLSYNYGVLLGSSLGMQGIPSDSIKIEDLVAGLEASLKTKMSDDQVQAAQGIFMQKMEEIQEQQAKVQRDKEKQWFDENAKNNTKVKTLDSGIQYEVMKEGEGPKPTAQDKVTTHYHGTLTDGTVFDSSVERGSPATFPVMGVIKGWQEILQLMPVGSKWKVYIPSELAYGSRAMGSIPANSILIFEIELLKIEGQ
jgi:FKBP-type peptidyl-prolyl cis-trans isomerase FklB